MNKILLLIAIVVLSARAFAQPNPEWTWASRSGGALDDESGDITSDNSGNSYVIGSYRSNAYFGSTMLSCSGLTDVFVAKLDSAGNYLWAKRAGGTGYDYGYGICLDYNGNVCISGSFSASGLFGTTSLSAAGQTDVFIAKLDSAGNWLWAQRGGGIRYDSAYSLSVDDLNNIYTTGFFVGPASFGSTSFTGVAVSNYEMFTAKLDSSGNWLWAKRTGSSGWDYGYGISTEASGFSFVTGTFESYIAFGTTELSSNGTTDAFVAKIDPDGNWLWAVNVGGSDYDSGNGVSCSDGNCYVTGNVFGNTVFGSTSLVSYGDTDIFVAKIDGDGNWLWARNAGGPGYDIGMDISSDDAQNCYVTGWFEITSSFGTTTLTASGTTDVFAAELDMEGNWLWAVSTGSGDQTEGKGIIAQDGGYCVLTGTFYGSVPFGDTILSSTGNKDVFVSRVSSGAAPTGIPLPPQNVVMTTNGWDLYFSWDPVSEDTGGQPITPDYYEFEWSSDPQSGFTFLTQVTETSWAYYGSAWRSNAYYRIKAVVQE